MLLTSLAVLISVPCFVVGLVAVFVSHQYHYAYNQYSGGSSSREEAAANKNSTCVRPRIFCCAGPRTTSKPFCIGVWALVSLSLLLAAAYAGLAALGSNTLFSHPNNYKCVTQSGLGAPDALMDGTPFGGNTPARWHVLSYDAGAGPSSALVYVLANGLTFPASNWTSWVPGDWANVEFYSRPSPGSGTRIKNRAWYTNTSASAPLVILAHGRGECKSKYESLLPANMLHRAGFSTLLMDYRNHGESERSEGGKLTWGVGESLDVLGAWDWAVAQGVAPDSIGLHAPSMGGGAVSLAIASDPRVRSAFVDAPACDPYSLVSSNVASAYGGVLSPIAAMLTETIYAMSSARTEYNVWRQPYQELGRLRANQSYAAVGTVGDLYIPADMVKQCYAAAAASQAKDTMLWILDDEAKYRALSIIKARPEFETRWVAGSHVRLMLYEPREYEARLVGWFRRTLAAQPAAANWEPHARRLHAALGGFPVRHRFNALTTEEGSNPFAWMDALAARMRRRKLLRLGEGEARDAAHAELQQIAEATRV